MSPAKNFCAAEGTACLRIRSARMVFSVAGQRASATEISRARVRWAGRRTRGGCDIITIEIDQVFRAHYSVGIVARRARGFLVHDVEAMSAALTLAVYRAEALIVEDAVTAMTFVAERV